MGTRWCGGGVRRPDPPCTACEDPPVGAYGPGAEADSARWASWEAALTKGSPLFRGRPGIRGRWLRGVTRTPSPSHGKCGTAGPPWGSRLVAGNVPGFNESAPGCARALGARSAGWGAPRPAGVQAVDRRRSRQALGRSLCSQRPTRCSASCLWPITRSPERAHEVLGAPD